MNTRNFIIRIISLSLKIGTSEKVWITALNGCDKEEKEEEKEGEKEEVAIEKLKLNNVVYMNKLLYVEDW